MADRLNVCMIKANKVRGGYRQPIAVRVNVLDTKKLQAYAPLAAAAVIVWWPLSGAWFMHETTEGIDYARNVLVCWPDMNTAQANHPEYWHEMFWEKGGLFALLTVCQIS